jgi:hypothetical protein
MGPPIRFCRQRAAYAIDANTVIGGASGMVTPRPAPSPEGAGVSMRRRYPTITWREQGGPRLRLRSKAMRVAGLIRSHSYEILLEQRETRTPVCTKTAVGSECPSGTRPNIAPVGASRG